MDCSLPSLRRALLSGIAVAALALPVGAVLAPAAGASGVAHVSSNAPACVASASYHASVKGSAIVSVTFTLDGRLLAKVRGPNARGAFAARVPLTLGRAHRLTMTVDFTPASHTSPRDFQRTLARCNTKIRTKKPTEKEVPKTGTAPLSEQTLPFTG